ncbi:MAG: hypothetical protein IKV00_09825, partial [Clostridia bacterium]|nr:hypothetical protein [Clostridia bacterium]
MFKSVFAKYITTFILIITVSFGMLLSIMLSLITDHSAAIRTDTVMNVASATESYLESRYERSDFTDFNTFVHTNKNEIFELVSSVVNNWDGISLFLADKNGKLILYASRSESGLFEEGTLLPEPALSLLQEGE